MAYLLSRTGPDMNHLSLEIDKVISYCQGRSSVTRADIEAVTGTQIENHIFEMIDAVTARNQKKALDLYADLLALKEPPLRILYLIARQFNQLLMIKELAVVGNSVPMIAQKTGIRDFVVRRSMNTVRNYTSDELRKHITYCTKMEEAAKTGNIAERLSVELLLIRFSARK
jgi:DNA polymerase-3 subunit delta